jgi:tetratricopeptide (TPR) repeat protein
MAALAGRNIKVPEAKNLTNETFLASSSSAVRQTRLTVRALTGSLTIAFSLSLLLHATTGSALASDFTHAKKVYVPASAYDRRVDFSSMGEASADASDSSLTGSSALSATGSRAFSIPSPPASSASGPYGLLPPPPASDPAAQINLPSYNQIRSAVNHQLPKGSPSSSFSSAPAPPEQASLPSSSSSGKNSAVAKLKQEAVEFTRAGKLDKAQKTWEQVVQLAPHDKTASKALSDIMAGKAEKMAQSGAHNEAMHAARQALGFDQSNSRAGKVLDSLLKEAGIDPSDPAARTRTGNELFKAGSVDEAGVEYRASLALKPTADAHIGLGNIAFKTNQKDKARAEYEQAVETEPKNANAHRQIGLVRYSQADVVGANAELSRALVLNPKDETAAKTLLDLWQQQVSKMPNANSHLGLARAYQLAGDLKSAQTEYKTVVRMDPQNPHLPAARQSFKLALARQEAERAFKAAHTLEDQGAITAAYQKAFEAVGLSPTDAEFRLYQGHLLEKLGQLAPARDAYMRVLKDDPQNVVAAQRLKDLPDPPTAPAVVPMLGQRDSLPAFNMPQLPVPRTPAMAQDEAILNRATSLSSPWPSSRPGMPTGNDVSTLSNFGVNLRNQMLQQKDQIQKVEDLAHSAIRQMTSPSATEALHIGAPPDLAAAAGAAAGAGGPATGAAAGASAPGDAPPGNIANVLAAARSALAAAHPGGKPGSTASSTGSAGSLPSAPVSSEPPVVRSMSSVAPPLTAPDIVAPPSPPPIAPDRRLSSFNPYGTSGPGNVPSPSGLAGNSSAGPGGYFATPASAVAPSAPSAGSSPPSGSGPDPMAGIDDVLRPAMPTGSQPISTPLRQPAAPSSLGPQTYAPPYAYAPPATSAPPALAQASAVKLELKGIEPHLNGVELAVVLSNNQDSSLSITPKMKAVIKYSNRGDAEVKAVFSDSTVPAHGQVKGTIKVPFDKVDPQADLIIPNLLPPGSANRDIHLTTEMALK